MNEIEKRLEKYKRFFAQHDAFIAQLKMIVFYSECIRYSKIDFENIPEENLFRW